MARHEYPYLQKPGLLEYPTETWPAQDLRKVEVFQAASRHATGAERQQFLERARFFFEYAIETLGTLPTRTLARPMVLLLSFGYSRAWFVAHPEAVAPAPSADLGEVGSHVPFVPQRVRAIRRAKVLLAAGAALVGIGVVGLLVAWL